MLSLYYLYTMNTLPQIGHIRKYIYLVVRRFSYFSIRYRSVFCKLSTIFFDHFTSINFVRSQFRPCNSTGLFRPVSCHPSQTRQFWQIANRVDIDPMLMKVNTTKQVMRTAIELLLDINPSINNFAYNSILTATPLCPCEETEETATHFLFDCTIYEATNRPAKNFNIYDLRDCVNLIEFIRTSGRFD